jgi:hypothetical protein
MEPETTTPKPLQDCWKYICEQVSYNTYTQVRLVSKDLSMGLCPKYPLAELEGSIPSRDCLSVVWQSIKEDPAAYKQMRMVSRQLRDIVVLDFSILRCRSPADVCSEWFKALPVTTLNLGGCRNINPNVCDAIKQMPITSLNLAHTDVSIDNLDMLKGMQLEELNLFNCKYINVNDIQQIRKWFPSLRCLDTSFTTFCHRRMMWMHDENEHFDVLGWLRGNSYL